MFILFFFTLKSNQATGDAIGTNGIVPGKYIDRVHQIIYPINNNMLVCSVVITVFPIAGTNSIIFSYSLPKILEAVRKLPFGVKENVNNAMMHVSGIPIPIIKGVMTLTIMIT